MFRGISFMPDFRSTPKRPLSVTTPLRCSVKLLARLGWVEGRSRTASLRARRSAPANLGQHSIAMSKNTPEQRTAAARQRELGSPSGRRRTLILNPTGTAKQVAERGKTVKAEQENTPVRRRGRL